MSSFVANKIDLNSINNGQRYENGQVPSANTFNAPIEASAYAQELADEAIVKAESALSKVNDSNAGEVTLSAYPIGSIYMSARDVSPAELFGGHWTKLQDRFLLGSGSKVVGDTGGKDRYHFIAAIGAYNSSPQTITYAATIAPTLETSLYPYGLVATPDSTAKTTINHGTMVVEEDTSNDQYTTIMPPYLVVNMWERIA